MTRSTTGRRSRAKGQAYERHLCAIFAEALPGTTWKRRVQFRGGRVDGSDIEGLDRDGAVIPLFLEAHCGQTKAETKLQQAIDDAPDGWHPIAVIHRPGKTYANDTALMRLGDLLELAGIPGDAWLDDETQDLIVTTNINAALHLIAGWYRRAR